MVMDARNARKPLPRSAARGRWECKRSRPSVLFGLLMGVILCVALIPYLRDVELGPLSSELVGLCLGMIIAGFILLLERLFFRRYDCLFMNEHGLVRIRRARGFEKAWALRFTDIQEITFRGGTFVWADLTARVRGHGFIIRTRWVFGIGERILNSVRFSDECLFLHPRLLKRLIEMAERRGMSVDRFKGLERARRYVWKAARETSVPVPVPANLPELPDSIRAGGASEVSRTFSNVRFEQGLANQGRKGV